MHWLQVAVDVWSETSASLRVRVVTYLLTADQVSNLHRWDPSVHVMSDSILHGTAEMTVVCNTATQQSFDGKWLYQGSCQLTFRGEKRIGTKHMSRARHISLR